MNTGATYHITQHVNMLHVHDNYHGCDEVRNARGRNYPHGMEIKHNCHSILHTHFPSSWNILHVSSALKILLSTHKLSLDNNASVEFHPFYFLIKDKEMKKIMLRGPNYDGLYHLVPHSTGSSKHSFITIKPSSST
jgi:hypothetical protein